MMLVFRDMIMHEAADSGLRIVSSKDWFSQVGLAPAENLFSAVLQKPVKKVLRDGLRKVAETLAVIKARRARGLLGKWSVQSLERQSEWCSGGKP